MLGPILGIPNYGADIDQHYGTEKLTQEFRLASRPGGSVDWLAGAFYTHEKSIFVQDLGSLFTTDGSTIPGLPDLSDGTGNSVYQEGALFGDVTYHFDSHIDVQGGLRYSKNRQSSYNVSEGLLSSPGETIGQGDFLPGRDNVPVFRQATKFDADNMAYARIASGYRAGGPNYTLAGNEYPFGSDKSVNYEIGLQGDLARQAPDHRRRLLLYHLEEHPAARIGFPRSVLLQQRRERGVQGRRVRERVPSSAGTHPRRVGDLH